MRRELLALGLLVVVVVLLAALLWPTPDPPPLRIPPAPVGPVVPLPSPTSGPPPMIEEYV